MREKTIQKKKQAISRFLESILTHKSIRNHNFICNEFKWQAGFFLAKNFREFLFRKLKITSPNKENQNGKISKLPR